MAASPSGETAVSVCGGSALYGLAPAAVMPVDCRNRRGKYPARLCRCTSRQYSSAISTTRR